MEALNNLISDLPQILTWGAVLAACIGTLWGIVAGALPGITTSVGTAILIPFTFSLSPEVALMLLIGVHIGGEYGGSIPAILLRIPGEPSNAPCIEDGYALHKQGKTGTALAMSLFPGAVGVFVAGLVFLFLSGPLTTLALKVGPAGYFALFVLAMTAIAGLGGTNVGRSMVAVFFGLTLAVIGTDPQSAATRLTFGTDDLREGLPLVPVVVGLFAISQLLIEASTRDPLAKSHDRSVRQMMRLPKLKEYRGAGKATAIGTLVGTVFGVLPGLGGTVASFVAHAEAKRWSKRPDLFGKGSYEGIAAPETANNAAGPAALAPAFALGIPGSASSAMVLAALVANGFRPGPALLDTAPQLLSAAFVAIMLSNIAMVVFGYALLPVWVALVSIRKSVLMPSVMILVTIGIMANETNMFAVWISLAMGVVGFFMIRRDFPIAPAVIAFVLGTLMEDNLRRALVISDGDWTIFLTDPISVTFLSLAVVMMIFVLRRKRSSSIAAALTNAGPIPDTEPEVTQGAHKEKDNDA